MTAVGATATNAIGGFCALQNHGHKSKSLGENTMDIFANGWELHVSEFVVCVIAVCAAITAMACAAMYFVNR